LLLGGAFRRRDDVERLRVPAFAPLDFRAVGDFRLLAAFEPDLAVDLRRVDLAPDADLRRVVVFLAADVDLRLVAVFFAPDVDLRRVVVFLAADVDLRLVVVFLADAALARGVDAAEDLRRDVDLRLVVVFFADVALRRDVAAAVDLRRDDDLRFDGEPPVTRFATPASAPAAFSICATPFATSSCASETALSTGLRSFDRLDLVVFRAAIAFSRQVLYPPLGRRSMECLARDVDNTLLTHKTSRGDTVDASSRSVRETSALRSPR
jgi:hypothetical protein